MTILTGLVAALSDINDAYLLFGAAGLVSLLAFGTLILTPALGSFSRGWEKLAAGVLSLFILVALVLVGLGLGFLVFYNWDDISEKI